MTIKDGCFNMSTTFKGLDIPIVHPDCFDEVDIQQVDFCIHAYCEHDCEKCIYDWFNSDIFEEWQKTKE